eukprot:3444906-Rhodomonas_salina.6
MLNSPPPCTQAHTAPGNLKSLDRAKRKQRRAGHRAKSKSKLMRTAAQCAHTRGCICTRVASFAHAWLHSHTRGCIREACRRNCARTARSKA